jgi:hypothetical protein
LLLAAFARNGALLEILIFVFIIRRRRPSSLPNNWSFFGFIFYVIGAVLGILRLARVDRDFGLALANRHTR